MKNNLIRPYLSIEKKGTKISWDFFFKMFHPKSLLDQHKYDAAPKHWLFYNNNESARTESRPAQQRSCTAE
jgi:hypothetical protein